MVIWGGVHFPSHFRSHLPAHFFHISHFLASWTSHFWHIFGTFELILDLESYIGHGRHNSNEYLSQLAYEYAPKLLSPSQHIISSRISYLGHILRHADSLEHISTFQTAHAYRLHRKRPGHPRVHWAEPTMTQAYQRHQIISSGTQIPRPHHIHHDIYHHPTEREVATLHSRFFGNTDLWRTLQPLAQNRRAWAELEVLR